MKLVPEIRHDVLAKSVARARERNIRLPTFAQLKDPRTAPAGIAARLGNVGLWDPDPANLYRITWKNEPVERGGGFGSGNWIEFPQAITGVDATIVGIVGNWFPTGSHKVGAAYGCLIPRLVTGNFDPESQKAVWPSTGNYCRGGAYDCALLACPAVAILPEGMSRERFEWLREIGTDEIIATPGAEANVKEIFDRCRQLRGERGNEVVVFNQFEEFGNAIWHYHLTGSFIAEVFQNHYGNGRRLAAYVSATGSAGTIAAGDFLRTCHPGIRVVAAEALQCPTLLEFGFGEHRIEGIGDKHIPWIHNVRNTDMVVAVDDEQTMQLMRLFNEEAGHECLRRQGVDEGLLNSLHLIGLSGLCNLVASIKTARNYAMDGRDVIFTPLTDAMDLYASRMQEARVSHGPYTQQLAEQHYARYLQGIEPDHLRELGYADRKALHNFKYFTWVEQQGRTADELRQLWDDDFWREVFSQDVVNQWDQLIDAFNQATGLTGEAGAGGDT
ncbi:MAG: pyridoxal-phosphate dependent enzyme [Gammaproteobacteria bacterium]|nr:pyridoxal-phosphate dependent enzyme [Gammaproteobacteria bacterium]